VRHAKPQGHYAGRLAVHRVAVGRGVINSPRRAA
jgi:hypothetical protein